MGRLNYLAAGYAIADEVIKRTGSTALALAHDTIRGTADLEIWTGPGKTGTKLTLTTDYTVSDELTDYSTRVGVTIYTKLAIVNGAYQNVKLYVTYKTIGDLASAESIRLADGAIGDLKPWPYHRVQDSNWEFANGGSLLRASYPAYFEVACANLGDCTITIASPGVVTCADHGLETGDQVFLETTGALPTGLSANTLYYAIYVSSSTFRLATSRANARSGTAINTSGTQSGTHNVRCSPNGIASATTFNKPDMSEGSPYGQGTRGAGITTHDALVNGEFADDRFQGHFHQVNNYHVTPGSYGSYDNRYGTVAIAGGASNNDGGGVTYPITDGSDGTPRIGGTTRGKLVAMKFIVRVQ